MGFVPTEENGHQRDDQGGTEWAIQFPNGEIEIANWGRTDRKSAEERLEEVNVPVGRLQGQPAILISRERTVTYTDWTPADS